MQKKYQDLIFSTLFFSIFILCYTKIKTDYFDAIIYHSSIRLIPIIIIWVLATHLLAMYTKVLFWQTYILNRTGKTPPKVLIELSTIIIWVISIIIATTVLLDKNITAILTASSVTIGIVGFALRSMIADFFYGIAIAIEQPYRVGDWINVEGKIGKVQQISWSVTQIVTKENLYLTLPNSLILSSSFNNYSYPDPLWRSKFRMVLGYEVTTNEAERIFLSAIKQIEACNTSSKQPEIRIITFQPNGIEWEIRFWIIDYPLESSVKYQIQCNVLRDLSYCNIALPIEKLKVFNEESHHSPHTKYSIYKQKQHDNWAKNLDLFEVLSAEECETISAQAQRKLIPVGEALFKQGDKGHSLFLLYQGLLDVVIENKDENVKSIDHIKVGDVFGENSLLTGEPRNATIIPIVDSIVYEIDKQIIEPYFHRYPIFLEHIEYLLTERKLHNMQMVELFNEEKTNEIKANILMDVKQKIRQFFNLKSNISA